MIERLVAADPQLFRMTRHCFFIARLTIWHTMRTFAGASLSGHRCGQCPVQMTPRGPSRLIQTACELDAMRSARAHPGIDPSTSAAVFSVLRSAPLALATPSGTAESLRAERDGERITVLEAARPRRRRQSRVWCSLSALAITDTELRLIAAAASIGLSSQPNAGHSTPAAIGTPRLL